MRIQGWLGRADQTTKIKGMFVHPQQIERIRLSVKGIKKMRLVVKLQDHQDKMQLLCEYDQDQSELTKLELTGLLLDNLKQYTKLNGSVELVELGSLADDGKVIDDQRVIG